MGSMGGMMGWRSKAWTAACRTGSASQLVRPLHGSAASAQRFAQDRVGTDGVLLPSGAPPAAPGQDTYVIGSPLPGSAAPAAPPLETPVLEQLVEMLQSAGGAVVLTGAGASTESNVPDYRSPGGAYSTGFKPMTHQAFLASPQNRARYWSRSFTGWHRFSRVQPNATHSTLARLQRVGWVGDVITQNVDRLHHKGGSAAGSVLELHGTTHEVVCMGCRRITPRDEVQRRLAALNPEAAAAVAALVEQGNARDERGRIPKAGTAEPSQAGRQEELPLRHHPDVMDSESPQMRPDGDVELAAMGAEFLVPPCAHCGGVLKPDVVFFGDSLPPKRAQRALQLASEAPALLVVGSSLAVWSAFRLAKAAKENGAKLAILNVGPTRADDLADLLVPARAGEAMMRLATHPSLLVPPPRGWR